MQPKLLLACIVFMFTRTAIQAAEIETDILIVGGTESGCAAAVQAARMGVRRIVLVNDIEWLGGQFSAEALGAIDENRAHGYDGTVPIPRSGIFREVIDAIESKNAQLYGGIKRPGNTRVITTSRPIVSEGVFRALLKPYEDSGRVTRYSNYRVDSVRMNGDRVDAVVFESIDADADPLTVRAKLTIDASDWGDVIRESGAAYDFGIDTKAEYGEPAAPSSNEPITDMNPITYCMILVEQDNQSLYPEPEGYDPRSFTGLWGWISEAWAYESRRLVDGKGFDEIDHPDVLLINNPDIDYPLDIHTHAVATALEATEPGASKKNIVQLTPKQRQIILDDAKLRTRQYYFYLQSNFPKFRKLVLSDEFGTPDSLPPKPYIREGLRLVAKHVVKEQEVLGFQSRSNYATAMFHDGVFSWQFEMDYHPTARKWLTTDGDKGAWEAVFRGSRRFGRGGTGRVMFPVRGFVPERVKGLLGAQKNLGYTSIVSSSCRLHDQSTAVGQACAAIAAVSLQRDIDPGDIPFDNASLAAIWSGLLDDKQGVPVAIWPFADMDPLDDGFVAVQQLALRRLFPLRAGDTSFRPDNKLDARWAAKVLKTATESGYDIPQLVIADLATKRDFAVALWQGIASQPLPDRERKSDTDADADGIPDDQDALPFTPKSASWSVLPELDGVPDPALLNQPNTQAFNFTSAGGQTIDGFQSDIGAAYSQQAGFGWKADLRKNVRSRGIARKTVRDGFVFTRKQDVWELDVESGKYAVTLCIGDIGHDQPGQNVTVEGNRIAKDVDTTHGNFLELTTNVEVTDGRLTITLGKPEGGSNTTINWLIVHQE